MRNSNLLTIGTVALALNVVPDNKVNADELPIQEIQQECNETLYALETEIANLERLINALQSAAWNLEGVEAGQSLSDMDQAIRDAFTYVLPESPMPIEDVSTDEIFNCINRVVSYREYFFRLLATWYEMRTDVSNMGSNRTENLEIALSQILPDQVEQLATNEFRRRMQRIVTLVSPIPSTDERRIVASDDTVEINGLEVGGYVTLPLGTEIQTPRIDELRRLYHEGGEFYESRSLPEMLTDCTIIRDELVLLVENARALVVARELSREAVRSQAEVVQDFTHRAPYRSQYFSDTPHSREQGDAQYSEIEALNNCTIDATTAAIYIARLREFAIGLHSDTVAAISDETLNLARGAIVLLRLGQDTAANDFIYMLDTFQTEVEELSPTR